MLKLIKRKLGVRSTKVKKNTGGRKMTPLKQREEVWSFWHSNCTASTLTSRPAKIKVSNKPKLQADLPYHDSVTNIKQRNRDFYQSQWLVHCLTILEMYVRYCAEHLNPVSYGTFIGLRPFYVRSATTKDIEMCVC